MAFKWFPEVKLTEYFSMILDHLGATSKSPEEGEESDDDDRPKFRKPPEDLQRWIEELGSSNPAPEQEGESATENPDPAALSELQEHKDFILQSKAYLWLLSKLKQHAILSTGSKLSELSEVLRGKFKTQHSLRKMSSRRPSPTIQLTLEIDWSPFPFLRAQKSPGSFELLIEQILCVTGSCQEAQATLAREYMVQTWPITGNATFDVIRDLVSVPEGQQVSCESTLVMWDPDTNDEMGSFAWNAKDSAIKCTHDKREHLSCTSFRRTLYCYGDC
jgi:hypothetical protein